MNEVSFISITFIDDIIFSIYYLFSAIVYKLVTTIGIVKLLIFSFIVIFIYNVIKGSLELHPKGIFNVIIKSPIDNFLTRFLIIGAFLLYLFQPVEISMYKLTKEKDKFKYTTILKSEKGNKVNFVFNDFVKYYNEVVIDKLKIKDNKIPLILHAPIGFAQSLTYGINFFGIPKKIGDGISIVKILNLLFPKFSNEVQNYLIQPSLIVDSHLNYIHILSKINSNKIKTKKTNSLHLKIFSENIDNYIEAPLIYEIKNNDILFNYYFDYINNKDLYKNLEDYANRKMGGYTNEKFNLLKSQKISYVYYITTLQYKFRSVLNENTSSINKYKFYSIMINHFLLASGYDNILKDIYKDNKEISLISEKNIDIISSEDFLKKILKNENKKTKLSLSEKNKFIATVMSIFFTNETKVKDNKLTKKLKSNEEFNKFFKQENKFLQYSYLVLYNKLKVKDFEKKYFNKNYSFGKIELKNEDYLKYIKHIPFLKKDNEVYSNNIYKRFVELGNKEYLDLFFKYDLINNASHIYKFKNDLLSKKYELKKNQKLKLMELDFNSRLVLQYINKLGLNLDLYSEIRNYLKNGTYKFYPTASTFNEKISLNNEFENDNKLIEKTIKSQLQNRLEDIKKLLKTKNDLYTTNYFKVIDNLRINKIRKNDKFSKMSNDLSKNVLNKLLKKQYDKFNIYEAHITNNKNKKVDFNNLNYKKIFINVVEKNKFNESEYKKIFSDLNEYSKFHYDYQKDLKNVYSRYVSLIPFNSKINAMIFQEDLINNYNSYVNVFDLMNSYVVTNLTNSYLKDTNSIEQILEKVYKKDTNANEKSQSSLLSVLLKIQRKIYGTLLEGFENPNSSKLKSEISTAESLSLMSILGFSFSDSIITRGASLILFSSVEVATMNKNDNNIKNDNGDDKLNFIEKQIKEIKDLIRDFIPNYNLSDLSNIFGRLLGVFILVIISTFIIFLIIRLLYKYYFNVLMFFKLQFNYIKFILFELLYKENVLKDFSKNTIDLFIKSISIKLFFIILILGSIIITKFVNIIYKILFEKNMVLDKIPSFWDVVIVIIVISVVVYLLIKVLDYVLVSLLDKEVEISKNVKDSINDFGFIDNKGFSKKLSDKKNDLVNNIKKK